MTRGGFRYQLVMLILLTVIPVALLLTRADQPWDEFHFLLVAILVLDAAFLVYLLYARRRDAHFWDEEEARRADWDRRGRQL
jgi:hypothetical protein